jgi:hypothetical protein
MAMIDREAIAQKIEEHISVLVDYDVIGAQVGDTLSEYVWAIILESQNKDEEKLAPVVDLGERNEVHILGPVGLKRNWETSKEDSSRG